MVLTAEQQRAQRTRRNYGKNAIGKLVRKKAFRDCDYTADGHLQQFTDEAGVIAFEEERYTSGQHQAHYSTEAKETVPREQLALEYVATMEAMRNKLASKEGHQTRVHQEQLAEGLHERLDHLQEIAEGKACEQLKLKEKKLEIAKAKAEAKAEAKAIENEAFTQRVEAGNGTQLEEKQLQLKILAEDIRQHKAKLALEKARGKAERSAAFASPRPPAAAKRAPTRAAQASTTEPKRCRNAPLPSADLRQRLAQRDRERASGGLPVARGSHGHIRVLQRAPGRRRPPQAWTVEVPVVAGAEAHLRGQGRRRVVHSVPVWRPRKGGLPPTNLRPSWRLQGRLPETQNRDIP
jgi:hypothetical protein